MISSRVVPVRVESHPALLSSAVGVDDARKVRRDFRRARSGERAGSVAGAPRGRIELCGRTVGKDAVRGTSAGRSRDEPGLRAGPEGASVQSYANEMISSDRHRSVVSLHRIREGRGGYSLWRSGAIFVRATSRVAIDDWVQVVLCRARHSSGIQVRL